MTEEWKPIKGYEDYYEISNTGRIMSLNYRGRNYKQEMFGNTDKRGYVQINLNGKKCKLHRLVALTFIPNPQNKSIVHHIDENKNNNSAENLMWVTKAEHNHLHKKGCKNQGVIKRLGKPVLCIETGIIYSSTKEAGRQLGLNQSHISMVCRGVYKQHKGLHFEYVNKEVA